MLGFGSNKKRTTKTKKPAVKKVKTVKKSTPAKKKTAKTKETFPHFRKYKKSGHPALIVGEQVNAKQKEEYKFRKVMHGEKDGRHTNEKVFPNPNPNDKEPMHIAKRVRSDEKKFFGNRLPWKYPDENEKK